MGVVLHNRDAAHDGMTVSACLLVKAPAAAWKIVHDDGRFNRKTFEIDDVDVGLEAGCEPAPVFEADHLSRRGAERLDCVGEGQRPFRSRTQCVNTKVG